MNKRCTKGACWNHCINNSVIYCTILHVSWSDRIFPYQLLLKCSQYMYAHCSISNSIEQLNHLYFHYIVGIIKNNVFILKLLIISSKIFNEKVVFNISNNKNFPFSTCCMEHFQGTYSGKIFFCGFNIFWIIDILKTAVIQVWEFILVNRLSIIS